MGRATPSRFAWDMLVFPLKSCSPSSPRQAWRPVSPSLAKPQEAGSGIPRSGNTDYNLWGLELEERLVWGGLGLGCGPLRKICTKILLMRTSQATSHACHQAWKALKSCQQEELMCSSQHSVAGRRESGRRLLLRRHRQKGGLGAGGQRHGGSQHLACATPSPWSLQARSQPSPPVTPAGLKYKRRPT